MKIAVTGTRGIPNIQGGVETHCENLFPLIAEKGHEVILFRRDSYTSDSPNLKSFKNIQLIDVPTPHRKSLEAIIHTFRCIIKAKRLKVDIVHIHAIGPALLTPLARLLGLKVVVTHHGPDYDRAKWGPLAKKILKLGERAGAKWANKVIVISKVIDNLLQQKYGRVPTQLIFNGVPSPIINPNTSFLQSLGLQPKKYVLALGRFVPEKNFHQLIQAFSKANTQDFKLVIAGDADIEDLYSRKLKELAKKHNTILPGFVKGEKLSQLMSHASLFVLPSSHEGLPISLLEAMSYSLDVLASNIPANTIPELTNSDFFPVNNIEALSSAISHKLSLNTPRHYNLQNYNWTTIADQTEKLYQEILK